MRIPRAIPVVALAILTTAAPPPPSVVRCTGTAVPITKRSGLANADRSIGFEAFNSHVASAKAKVLRGLNNFQRNTGTLHPAALNKGTQRRATGAGALTDDDSQLWFGSISVGTPPSTFTVDFDTGSSDLFLPGPDCTSTCTGHTIYDPSVSSTSQDLGQVFTLLYEDGTVSGGQFSETVTVSGLTAVNQTLGVASEYSSSFAVAEFPPDGLMGMGFQPISVYNTSSAIESLISQGQVGEPVFSFKLAASGAELYLGGANSALYTGDFSYTPVTQVGYWEVNMDSVDIEGQPVLRNVDSIIDTGTTLVIGDPSSVEILYDALGGASAADTLGEGYYTFPCDRFPSNISFTFGGTSFPISADTLNYGPVISGSNDCISGIIGQDTGASFWIVGDVFLQNVYTSFDVGNTRVGFAHLA